VLRGNAGCGHSAHIYATAQPSRPSLLKKKKSLIKKKVKIKIRDIFSLKNANYFWKVPPASKSGFQKALLWICERITKYSNYIYCQARRKNKPGLCRKIAIHQNQNLRRNLPFHSGNLFFK